MITNPPIPPQHRPEVVLTRSRLAWDFVLILLTAGFTGIGSWFVSHYQLSAQQDFWIQQQQILGANKLHDSRLAYLEKIQRLISEFRSTSTIYFFAEVDEHEGVTVADRDIKHDAFHRLDSELHSCLRVLPFFFDEKVEEAVRDLEAYFDKYPWENLIQNEGFLNEVAEADRQHSAGDTATKMIATKIRLDEYDECTGRVIGAMAEEIADNFN